MGGRENNSQVCYAQAPDDVTVVKIVGRGTLELSPRLSALLGLLNRPDYSPRYILDLSECTTLDSTFLGVIATLAIHQTYSTGSHTIVVNTNEVTMRQIETMGLQYLVELHTPPPPETDEIGDRDFKRVAAPRQSRTDHLLHMIASHEALIDVNSGNEMVFRPVLESLQESLERAKNNEAK
ncbi:STAS domain-containing protein [Candidatus Sumerlaeota bacterium]|nr:STAS domain-containing protein [Candidatus Sumerlaeota bacterium]